MSLLVLLILALFPFINHQPAFDSDYQRIKQNYVSDVSQNLEPNPIIFSASIDFDFRPDVMVLVPKLFYTDPSYRHALIAKFPQRFPPDLETFFNTQSKDHFRRLMNDYLLWAINANYPVYILPATFTQPVFTAEADSTLVIDATTLTLVRTVLPYRLYPALTQISPLLPDYSYQPGSRSPYALTLQEDYATSFLDSAAPLSFSQKKPLFDQAVKYAPRSSNVYNRIGLTYTQNQLPQEALYYYEQAVLLDSQNATAHFNLVYTLMALNRFDEARAELYNVIVVIDSPDIRAQAQALIKNLHLKSPKL